MNKKTARYGDHFIDESDIESVKKVLQGDFLTTGPQIELFEKKFSKTVGSKYSLSCVNGTAALHLSIKALGIGQDDFVIVPNVTFFATVSAVIMTGATPILCDVCDNNGLIDENSLKNIFKKIGYKKIKAVIVVHLNGNIVDLSILRKITKKIPIIEDSCHALGSKKKENKNIFSIGSCHNSSISTFSFHPVKSITTGEGGMITTNNKTVFKKLLLLRNHFLDRLPMNNKNFPYDIKGLGFNYRLSDVNCALGISQLKKLDVFKKHRKKLVKRYNNYFSFFKDSISYIKNEKDDIFWHLYVVLIDFKKIGISRPRVMSMLKRLGIGSQIHYKPIHGYRYMRDNYKKYFLCDFDGSIKYYNKILTLPLHYNLNLEDVDYVCNNLLEILRLKKID